MLEIDNCYLKEDSIDMQLNKSIEENKIYFMVRSNTIFNPNYNYKQAVVDISTDPSSLSSITLTGAPFQKYSIRPYDGKYILVIRDSHSGKDFFSVLTKEEIKQNFYIKEDNKILRIKRFTKKASNEEFEEDINKFISDSNITVKNIFEPANNIVDIYYTKEISEIE